ncbi:hypothetical protein B0H19DRAFT_1110831 [Mycena capillaripes]|nr:hypothetical protein B0H19DRAFT_1110831 [Mycena capillaripes]
MSFSVADLPPDVLLEVVKQLDAADLISFLSTCRVIRELQLQRTLWLHALIRIRQVEMQPLPLAKPEALSLPELQNAVRHACRLMKILRSDKPRPVRVNTLSVESGSRILTIPGSNLVMIHLMGSCSCWDIPTSQLVAHLEIPDLQIKTEACMEIEGKALFAACTPDLTKLVVVCVDFWDRAHISISHVISPAIEDLHRAWNRFFINARDMGFCTTSSIILWSMDAHAGVRTIPHHVDDPLRAPCLAFGGTIYVGSDRSAWEHSILAIPLPAASDHHPNGDDHPTTDKTTFMIPSTVGCSPDEFAMSTWPSRFIPPHYGIFAVTHRTLWAGPGCPVLPLIHFWPARVTRNKLEFAPGCVYKHLQPISQIAIGASGKYVLFRVEEEHGYLGLLHFSATPAPRTTFRKLDIGNLPMSSLLQIALDDSLGLVFVHSPGEVTVISYV